MHVFLAISVHANLHLTTNSSTFVSLLSQPCTARTDWIRLLKTSHLLAGFPATFAAENPAAKYKQIQMYICMTSLEVSLFVNLCKLAILYSIHMCSCASLSRMNLMNKAVSSHVQKWNKIPDKKNTMIPPGLYTPKKKCLTESIHYFHDHHISTSIGDLPASASFQLMPHSHLRGQKDQLDHFVNCPGSTAGAQWALVRRGCRGFPLGTSDSFALRVFRGFSDSSPNPFQIHPDPNDPKPILGFTSHC